MTQSVNVAIAPHIDTADELFHIPGGDGISCFVCVSTLSHCNYCLCSVTLISHCL